MTQPENQKLPNKYIGTATVIGAGVAGLTAAHELVERGFRVKVLEAAGTDDEVTLGGMAATQWLDPKDAGPGVTCLNNDDPSEYVVRAWFVPKKWTGDDLKSAEVVRPEDLDREIERVLKLVEESAREIGNEEVTFDIHSHVRQGRPRGKSSEQTPDSPLLVARARTRALACRLRKELKFDDVVVRGAGAFEGFSMRLSRFVSITLRETVLRADEAAKTAKERELEEGVRLAKAAFASAAVAAAAQEAGIDEGGRAQSDESRESATTNYTDLLSQLKEEKGKAKKHSRETDVEATATIRVGPSLPGEHGYRFFPSFYRNLFATLQKITIPTANGSTSDTVFDHLRPTTRMAMADPDHRLIPLLRRMPRSLEEVREQLRVVFDELHFTPEDIVRFELKMFRFLTSCDARRKGLESISSWDYFEGPKFSHIGQVRMRHSPQALVAMSADYSDARTHASIMTQLMLDGLTDGSRADMVLTGPTSSSWFDHWRDQLVSLGVEFSHTTLQSFVDCADGVRAITVDRHGELTEYKPPVEARRTSQNSDKDANWRPRADTPLPHYYVLATDARTAQRVTRTLAPGGGVSGVISELAHYPLNRGDQLPKETDPLRILSGIQFYFDRTLENFDGHIYYHDSPWGLSSISQVQFWRQGGSHRPQQGRYRTVLSIDIGRADVTGYHGKTMWEATRDELASEVWEQVRRSLGGVGNAFPVPTAYHIDDNLIFNRFDRFAVRVREKRKGTDGEDCGEAHDRTSRIGYVTVKVIPEEKLVVRQRIFAQAVDGRNAYHAAITPAGVVVSIAEPGKGQRPKTIRPKHPASTVTLRVQSGNIYVGIGLQRGGYALYRGATSAVFSQGGEDFRLVVSTQPGGAGHQILAVDSQIVFLHGGPAVWVFSRSGATLISSKDFAVTSEQIKLEEGRVTAVAVATPLLWGGTSVEAESETRRADEQLRIALDNFVKREDPTVWLVAFWTRLLLRDAMQKVCRAPSPHHRTEALGLATTFHKIVEAGLAFGSPTESDRIVLSLIGDCWRSLESWIDTTKLQKHIAYLGTTTGALVCVDLFAGKQLAILDDRPHIEPISALEVGLHGGKLVTVTGGQDGQIGIWETLEHSCRRAAHIEAGGPVTAVSMASGSRESELAHSHGNSVRSHSFSMEQLEGEFATELESSCHTSPVTALAFIGPDEGTTDEPRTLCIGTQAGELSTRNGGRQTELWRHQGPVMQLEAQIRGRGVVSASADGEVHLLDIGRDKHTAPVPKSAVQRVRCRNTGVVKISAPASGAAPRVHVPPVRGALSALQQGNSQTPTWEYRPERGFVGWDAFVFSQAEAPSVTVSEDIPDISLGRSIQDLGLGSIAAISFELGPDTDALLLAEASGASSKPPYAQHLVLVEVEVVGDDSSLAEPLDLEISVSPSDLEAGIPITLRTTSSTDTPGTQQWELVSAPERGRLIGELPLIRYQSSALSDNRPERRFGEFYEATSANPGCFANRLGDNLTPFHVNPVDDFARRPGCIPERREPIDYHHRHNEQPAYASHHIYKRELVLAGTYMKTYTRLTTMEAANESARHAVNTILADLRRRSGFESPGDDAPVWDPEQNEFDELKFLKRMDARLFEQGSPHFMDILELDRIPEMMRRGVFDFAGAAAGKRLLDLLPIQPFVDNLSKTGFAGLPEGMRSATEVLQKLGSLLTRLTGSKGSS